MNGKPILVAAVAALTLAGPALAGCGCMTCVADTLFRVPQGLMYAGIGLFIPLLLAAFVSAVRPDQERSDGWRCWIVRANLSAYWLALASTGAFTAAFFSVGEYTTLPAAVFGFSAICLFVDSGSTRLASTLRHASSRVWTVLFGCGIGLLVLTCLLPVIPPTVSNLFLWSPLMLPFTTTLRKGLFAS